MTNSKLSTCPPCFSSTIDPTRPVGIEVDFYMEDKKDNDLTQIEHVIAAVERKSPSLAGSLKVMAGVGRKVLEQPSFSDCATARLKTPGASCDTCQ